MLFANLQNKVKELLFSADLDILVVCLEKGVLINLALELTHVGVVPDDEETQKTLAWVSETSEIRLEKTILQTEGNLLATFNLIQSESDTPLLDVRGCDQSATGGDELSKSEEESATR